MPLAGLAAALLSGALLSLAPGALAVSASAKPRPAPAHPLDAPTDAHSSDAPPPDSPAPDSHPIDGRQSSASFVVHLRWRGPAEGRAGVTAGQLGGSAAAGWQVQVRLDARGLRMDGPRWMERATRSPQFLAVDRYPTIRFDSDAFDDALLRAGGTLHGRLELRGRSREVDFHLQAPACARPGIDCEIRVDGSVDRRDFGMTAYRAIVEDTVDLHMRVRLRARP